jgi:Lrp/AsnC family leucine-responsive transcriptional regulator
MKAYMNKHLHLADLVRDPRNIDLLALLQKDPRMNVSELARRMGMSAPAVRERLARLEDAQVIQGYRLDLNAAALGWPLQAYIRIRPMPGQLPKIARLAASLPQVAECYRITGEDCFIVRVYLESVETLDQVLDKFLAFGQTTTSLIQSTIVPSRTPPLPSSLPRRP